MYMNKVVVWLLCLLGIAPLWGQQLMRVPRFFDNWSVTASAGTYHPLAYSPNSGLAASVFGVELKKQFSPVLGLAIEYNHFSKNTQFSSYWADRPQAHLVGSLNLMNFLGRYRGKSRFFEVDLKWGVGAGTYTAPWPGTTEKDEYLVSKVGFDLNFNFGRNRVWSLTLRPAVVFDLRGKGHRQAVYDTDQADMQLMAGITYHFLNHDKRRNFSFADPSVVVPVVEEKRRVVVISPTPSGASPAKPLERSTKENVIVAETKPATKPEVATADTAAVAPPVEKPMPEVADTLLPTQRSWQMNVAFEEGSAQVEEAQFFNIEHMAYILQHRPKAKVYVQGYATPEEQKGRRDDLSLQRARIIKVLLVAQYGVSSERVVIYGRGAHREFKASEWPSVATCLVDDTD